MLFIKEGMESEVAEIHNLATLLRFGQAPSPF